MDYEENMKIFLMELLNFTLMHSFFRWEDKWYLQKSGTAMGNPAAPSYANIFMHQYETNHILQKEQWQQGLRLYLRYIDDIFLLWKDTRESLISNITQLNQIDQRIQFTYEIHDSQINYLEVTIKKTNDKFETTLYSKTTDRNNLLTYQSFHPTPLKQHLPYSQLLRVKRIVSDPEESKAQTQIILNKFKKRGYPNEVLNAALERAQSKDRKTLLSMPKTEKTNKTTCVSKYSTVSPQFKKIIQKHWRILQIEPDFNNIFIDEPIFAFSRAKNLGEIIKNVTSMKPNARYKGTILCKNCSNCNNIMEGNTIAHPMKGNRIKLQVNGTCDTKNIVYMMKCPCGKAYVGQTERKLKTRLTEHKSNIRTKALKSAVAAHFVEHNHQINQIKACILEIVEKNEETDNRKVLLKRENHWIYYLQTFRPYGMNERTEFSCYL
ncbi:uncharacterized protein LOC144772893 [Lissotriton helveticus]